MASRYHFTECFPNDLSGATPQGSPDKSNEFGGCLAMQLQAAQLRAQAELRKFSLANELAAMVRAAGVRG